MGNFKRSLILIVIAASISVFFLRYNNNKPYIIWNTTSSLPKGFYKIEQGYTYGDIIAFDIPTKLQKLVKERHWIPLYDRLLKRIVGLEGDQICFQGNKIFLNNNYFGITSLTDSKGRPMPQLKGCHTIEKGHVWVMLKNNPLSLDSRYYGQVAESTIYGKAVPIFQY